MFQRQIWAVGEVDGISKYYDGGGTLATDDLGVTILSGSTVGGGTTVNWMTCLDPPDSILDEWANKFGVSNVLKEQYRTSLMAVRRRLNVNEINSKLNPQNELLLKGCNHFGFATQLIQRNAMDCGDCGYCGFGCRAGAKQDTRQTYLADACRLGVEVLDSCEVQSIERDGHRATHAIAQVRQEDGEIDTIKIKFRAAIVACGSIQSAALLLRSGFENPHIGQNLKLHPTTAVAAFYETPIHQWKGAPQTIVCDEFHNLDGRQHGVRLETAPCHVGYGAMALAWNGPLQHKRLMCNFHRMANTIVICRDSGSGTVEIDEKGQPVIRYQLNELDEQHLMVGSERALEIHRAMGAQTMISPMQKYVQFTSDQSDEEFNQALINMEHLGGRSNSLALFSAHQMSTLRMADSPLRGAVDRKGRCFDAQNVFVCDASIFPSAIGVNPMITVMSMSHMLSQTIRDEGFSVYDF